MRSNELREALREHPFEPFRLHLTIEHVKKIAARFSVNPSIFID